VDEAGSCARNFVRAMDAPTPLPQSATPRSTASSNGPGKRNDEVRVVVSRAQFVRAEVYNLIARTAQQLSYLLFNVKPPWSEAIPRALCFLLQPVSTL